MASATRSLLAATALLLDWQDLGTCQSEDELRAAFIGAFLHVCESHLSLIPQTEVQPPAGFDKRLDLYLVPSWPPRQNPVGAGELKLFRPNETIEYRSRLGRRLSDIHYVHALAYEEKLHGFFLDIVLNPKLVGQDCYDSLKKMCQVATDALYDSVNPIQPEALKHVAGIKAFAQASLDRTPRKLARKMQYGFLFPPMDLPGGSGRAKRGPAFVKSVNQDGLISIGVRHAGREQRSPYRTFVTKDEVQAAICLAVFEPGGKLVINTDELIAHRSNYWL